MLKKFFAASFVVLAVGSIATAGVMVDVLPAADPGAGFKAFTVKLTGTEGAQVGGVISMNLTGAHQIWQNAAAGASSQTPVNNDAGTGAFSKADWNPFDTHLLINPRAGGDNVTTSPGFGMSETNDGSNPGGLSADFLAPPAPFNTFPGSAGMGGLSFTGVDPTIAFLNPQPAMTDLLYVVLPGTQTASLTMRLLDSTATTFFDINNLVIGGGGGGDTTPPVITPLVQNVTLPSVITDLQLSATDDTTPIVWSALAYSGPGKNAAFPGAADATLGADGKFNWNPNGWKAGVHTFNAIATDSANPANATASSLALTVNLTVPEPATLSMLGLALVGCVGVIRRRG